MGYVLGAVVGFLLTCAVIVALPWIDEWLWRRKLLALYMQDDVDVRVATWSAYVMSPEALPESKDAMWSAIEDQYLEDLKSYKGVRAPRDREGTCLCRACQRGFER